MKELRKEEGGAGGWFGVGELEMEEGTQQVATKRAGNYLRLEGEEMETTTACHAFWLNCATLWLSGLLRSTRNAKQLSVCPGFLVPAAPCLWLRIKSEFSVGHRTTRGSKKRCHSHVAIGLRSLPESTPVLAPQPQATKIQFRVRAACKNR